MKKVLFILSIFIILSCKGNDEKTVDSVAVNQINKQQKKLKRYEVKSGIVKYKITIKGKVMGSIVTGSGTENLFFKNWGAIELVESKSTKTTKMHFFGKEKINSQNTHTISKLENGKSYSVDFKNATIYLQRDPMMELMKNTNTDAGNSGKEMLKAMGGNKVGEERFLGYPCEIWDASGTKQWIYKGVTLKIESKIMGITTIKEAIQAKFNIPVSDSDFKLPNFPIIKETNYLSNDVYQAEQQETKVKMKQMQNMTFSEFKKMAKKDPEMQNMTDEELKQQFKLMKQMLKYSN